MVSENFEPVIHWRNNNEKASIETILAQGGVEAAGVAVIPDCGDSGSGAVLWQNSRSVAT